MVRRPEKGLFTNCGVYNRRVCICSFLCIYADLLHYSKVNIFQPSGSSFFRWVVIYLVYNPRKGAEINVRPHDMPFHILSPQGDDNVSSLNSMILHCNLSPQGDDKTSFMPSLVPLMRIATYPRKGTITRLPLPSADFSDCNLSPQGDDNLMAAVICCRSSPLQLIPVRGR